MKKHRKQNQKPTPAPQTAAPAGRSDDDFARQLAALFRSELGTEADAAPAEQPETPHRPELSEIVIPAPAAEAENAPQTEALRLDLSELLGHADSEPTPAAPPEPLPLTEEPLPTPERDAPEQEFLLALDQIQSVASPAPARPEPEEPAPAPAQQGAEDAETRSASEPETEPEPEPEQEPERSGKRSGLEEITLSRRALRARRKAAKRADRKRQESDPAPAAETEPIHAPALRMDAEELPPKQAEPEPSDGALWSDEALFAAIDDLLAHDAFSPREPAVQNRPLEAKFIPYEPEPEPEPEPEDREPTIRMNLSTEVPVITRPLPSLEELFGPKDEAAPPPEPPAVPEVTWDALPSLDELFGKQAAEPVSALPPEPPSPEPEEPHFTAEAEQIRFPLESERSRRRDARRKKRGWLSELLHPHPEPEFYFESDREPEPEPEQDDEDEGPLPDQLPLDGFASDFSAAGEWGLPNQLPLDDGFAPSLPQRGGDQIPDWLRHRRDSGETAPDAEIPDWLKSLAASDEVILPAKPRQETAPAPEAPAPKAPAPKAPAPQPRVRTAQEPEAADGPDLIPQVRMQTDPTAPRTGVLHLEDLLAAAVPIEETARPAKAGAAVEAPRKRMTRANPAPETPAAPPAPKRPAPETPAAEPEPKQTAPARPAAPKQTAEQKDSAPAEKPVRAEPSAGTEKPAAREKTAQTRPERPAAPDPERVFQSVQKPRTPTGEPVVSASVRSRRAAQTEETEPQPARPARRETAQRPAPAKRPDESERAILHPEEAYRKYSRTLSSVGSRLVLTGLFSLLSLFLTLYLLLDWKFLPEIFSGGTSVYVLLLLLAAMVLTNLKLYADAVRSLFRKPHSPDLLLTVATIFTALDAAQAAQSVRPPFVVVIGLLLLLSLWGKYDHSMALLATVRLLREKEGAVGVAEVQDVAGGGRGLTRTAPDVPQFMQKLETTDRCTRTVSIYVPVALLAGLGATLLIALALKGKLFWTGSLIFIGACPVAALLAFPRLFRMLAFRLSETGAALCGWHGAKVFGGEHAILIGDEDVFPQGALSLNGFKVYNGNPDRIIAYAAAASRRSGTALAPLFEDLLRIHVCRRYTVDSFRFYDSGGIGATIIGDVVLMGSLEFMRHMGVHMDKGAKVRQAVYLSINGELAAVFAVKYAPPENLRRGLAAIAGNRRFRGILVTRTFLGTPGFLKAKFGIPTGSFAYPTIRDRLRLSETELKAGSDQGAILTSDSFSAFAQAAAGGRTLRSATTLSTVLSIVSGVVGLLLMTVLAVLPAYEAATALNVLIYTAAWLVPTLLLSAWAKHF